MQKSLYRFVAVGEMGRMLTRVLWYFWLPPGSQTPKCLKRAVLARPRPTVGRSGACDQDTGQLCGILCRWPISFYSFFFSHHRLLREWGWTFRLGPVSLVLCSLGLGAVFCSRQHPGTKIWSDDSPFLSSDQGTTLCFYSPCGSF